MFREDYVQSTFDPNPCVPERSSRIHLLNLVLVYCLLHSISDGGGVITIKEAEFAIGFLYICMCLMLSSFVFIQGSLVS